MIFRKIYIMIFLLAAVGFSGCGGSFENETSDLNNLDMGALVQEQDAVIKQVRESSVQIEIDLEKINRIQEKLAEEER